MTLQPVDPDSPLTAQPPRTSLLTNLSHQTHLLHQLFTSLSGPTAPVPSSTPIQPNQSVPQLYANLSSATDEMRVLAEGLRAHQAAYAAMKRKEGEVRDLERRVRELLQTLEEGRRDLEGVVMESKAESLDSPRIPVPVLLSHARLLAKHSSAPTSQHMPIAEKGIYKPWPTENAMRQGILFIEGGSLPGLGDIEEQVPGQVGPVPLGDDEMEDIVEERRERRTAPAVFNLDLNSDSEDDD